MQILRAADYPVRPWKNGGGETREIAVFPPGAGMEDFSWRISMATVAQDGPFSMFADIDRTLFVLEGDGIELDFGNDNVETLDPKGSLEFPADAPVTSHLRGSTVTDLNVMTRRGRMRHTARRLDLVGAVELDCPCETTALFCVSGTCKVLVGSQMAELGARDCLIFSESPSSLTGEGLFIVIGINPIRE